MDRNEAHAILFKGQSNVLVMARQVGCSLEDLQASFRLYVASIPPTDEHWQSDVELGWPWC